MIGKFSLLKSTLYLSLLWAKISPTLSALSDRNLPPDESGYTHVLDIDVADYSYTQSDILNQINEFDRVAYYIELDDQWVWVSLENFASNLLETGVPGIDSDWTFGDDDTEYADMNVHSNVAGLNETGGRARLEFWKYQWSLINTYGIEGAGNDRFDFGDTMLTSSLNGCMQVHSLDNEQTIFAINHFHMPNNVNIVGIGNDPVVTYSDWTFGSIGPSSYQNVIVQVYVRDSTPTATPPTDAPAEDVGFEIHSTGNVTATAISGTSIRLIAPYNASIRDHDTTVLSSDCITPFDGIPEDAFTIVSTTKPLGPAHMAFNTTIDVDISKVNTTSYWKDLPGGALGGVFGLCLETSIYFSAELSDGTELTKEKMNFVNTNLTLTVEMDASFQVTSATSRDAAKQEEVRVDYSDYVMAYECVESDLVNKANGQEYSQGDELKICVKSKDPTIVQVGGIQRLTLSQDDDTTDDDFTYINGGNPVSSEIAATTCDKTITPAHVCHADMQLLGRYFEDESPGELTATGSVKLSFPDGSTSRRLTVDVPIASGIRGGDLALENSARHMEEEKPDDSPFDVTVSLKSLVESGSDYYGVSLVSGLVAAAGGAILMV